MDGYPEGVIAANDRLIVTTDKGTLYCFGAGTTATQTLVTKPVEMPPSAEWKDRAANLLKRTSSTSGYALVLGWSSGGLVRELVRQSALNLIVVESDAAIATKVRDEFSDAGLYDLATDPGERTNLYLQHSDITKELKALLEQSKATGRSRL